MAVESIPYRQYHLQESWVTTFQSLQSPLGTRSLPLTPSRRSKWRTGAWIGEDASDHDFVVVGSRKITKNKAVRIEVWNDPYGT